MKMKTKTNRWNRQMMVAAVFIAVILFVATGLFYHYSSSVRNYAMENSQEQLTDSSAHDADMVENQIMSGVTLLESIASDINMKGNREERLRMLRENKAVAGFSTLFLVDAAGNAMDGYGEKVSFDEKEGFSRILYGETVIEALNSGNSMNEEFIQIGTPIVRQGKVIGALYGKYDAYTISSIIETNSFQGEGYGILVDQEGSYLVNTTSEKARNKTCSNFYDFLKTQVLNRGETVEGIRKDVKNRKSAVVNYGKKEDGRVASLSPVGVNDWYLVKVVTYNHINAKARQIQSMSTVLAAEIIVLMTLLGIIILYMVIESHRNKNKVLADALNTANHATQSKSRFFAQMSHEIRTPMNAIIGLTEIAKTDVKDEKKMADYLEKIAGASRILLGIINDILDMSAMENHKMHLAEEPFDLKEIILSVSNIYYQQCRQKGVEFSVHVSRIVTENLIGDVLRINQILYNLLNNAIKFTPAEGQITLKAFQEQGADGTIHMMFVISDTGCGMSEEMKNRLFQPFEQESATTARKHGGSGLGLSIVKNLVTMMKGTIRVESEKGKGTSFHLDIPFAAAGEDPEQLETEKEKLHGIRVMVVDDDKEVLDYISLLLGRLHVRYTCMQKGELALEEMGEAEGKEDPYTICIVDWKMPEMNGLELTRQIRDIFDENTLVVVLSSYDLDEIEAEGKAAGVDCFMVKPLFQSTLFDLLMKLTAGKYHQAKEISPQQQDYQLAGKRILVAEDVALNIEVAVKLLSMQGMEAECAEDGTQAVQMFEKKEPHYYDAILMDVNMPEMDGYEATRTIRSSGKEDAKTIPIFAMTANAFTEDISAAYNAGMNGHISKPIQTEVLYETLAKVLSGKK